MKSKSGFTIVELLIVIVVIAILAAISVVAYNGISQKAREAEVTSTLTQIQKSLELYKVENGNYPTYIAQTGVSLKEGYSYLANSQGYCLSASAGNVVFGATESKPASSARCSAGTTNLALGKTATSPLITDGNTSLIFFDGRDVVKSVTVDLGSIQSVGKLIIWRYYGDARQYRDVVTEVSTDNINWSTVFSSATNGMYSETIGGKTINFPMRDVRYIRDSTNGSTANGANHWVEIQAY